MSRGPHGLYPPSLGLLCKTSPTAINTGILPTMCASPHVRLLPLLLALVLALSSSGSIILGISPQELLWQSDPPECLFGDLLDFLTTGTLALVSAIPHTDVVRTRTVILTNPLRPTAWCVRHGRDCAASRAHGNISGVPCVHHSRLGKRAGFKGACNHIFYVWVKQRLELKDLCLPSESITNIMTGPTPHPPFDVDRPCCNCCLGVHLGDLAAYHFVPSLVGCVVYLNLFANCMYHPLCLCCLYLPLLICCIAPTVEHIRTHRC